jgi:hypothetical protein
MGGATTTTTTTTAAPDAAASSCARPAPLPLVNHHHHPQQQQQQQQQQQRRPGAEGEGEEEDMVEIVLEGAAEGGAGGVEAEAAKATCMICYTEDLPPEETLVLPALPPAPTASSSTTTSHNNSSNTPPPSCPHSYCRTCVAAYLRTRVADGRATCPCPLFGEDGCHLVYPDAVLQELLDPETHRKHQRLLSLRADPSLRECPNPACGQLVAGGSKRQRRLACPGCGTLFCWLHAQAHDPSEGCAAFERAARRRERASASTVRRIAKRCPRCKAPTEKEVGLVVCVGGVGGWVGGFDWLSACADSEVASRFSKMT